MGAGVLGAAIGMVAELLVGEESGGGSAGAKDVLLNVVIAAAVAGVVLAVLAVRPTAATPVAWTLVGLAVLSVVLAWYAPMGLVLGATAFGVGGSPAATYKS